MISLKDANNEYRFVAHSKTNLRGGRITLVPIWSLDGFNEQDLNKRLKNCTDTVRPRIQQIFNQIQIATALREKIEK